MMIKRSGRCSANGSSFAAPRVQPGRRTSKPSELIPLSHPLVAFRIGSFHPQTPRHNDSLAATQKRVGSHGHLTVLKKIAVIASIAPEIGLGNPTRETTGRTLAASENLFPAMLRRVLFHRQS
jgi:hypothetical protein